ncbi:MAG: tetratricopeptide repeat protein [Chitinophagales bacterium]
MRFFLFIILFVLSKRAFTNTPVFEREYQLASEYFNKNQFDSSVIHLEICLKMNDTSVSALKLIGLCKYNLNSFQKGIDVFSKILSIETEDASAFNFRGVCYLQLSKYNLAAADFNKAIQLQPDYASAYNNKAIVIYKNQDIAKASITDLKESEYNFTKALALDSSLISVYKNRGIVRYHLGEYENSKSDLITAHYYNSKDINVLYYLSKGLQDNNDCKASLVYYTKLIEIAGLVAKYYLERADCYLQLSQFENAGRDISVAAKLPKSDLSVVEYYYARLAAAQNNKKELMTHLKKAEKQGLFKDKSYFAKIAGDNYFKFYIKDKEFYDYIQKLKFK